MEAQKPEAQMVVIDGKDAVLGRLASQVAGLATKGSEVRIINAEQVVISGRRLVIIKDYLARNEVGSRYKGPFSQKRPDLFVKRTIRGMLPKGPSGYAALRRIKAYIGVPLELAGMAAIPPVKNRKQLGTLNHITISELCSRLGWKPCQ